MTYRIDASIPMLEEKEVTPSGAWIVSGFLAGEGIHVYGKGENRVRELITAEALQGKESLETLRDAPLTVEHPMTKRVTPKNAQALTHGNVVSDRIEFLPQVGKLKISLSLRTERAQKTAPHKRYLSCGYDPIIDYTPGVHPVHGPYDQRQIGRRYNHVCMTKSPRGRLGYGHALDAVGDEPVDLEQAESPSPGTRQRSGL